MVNYEKVEEDNAFNQLAIDIVDFYYRYPKFSYSPVQKKTLSILIAKMKGVLDEEISD